MMVINYVEKGDAQVAQTTALKGQFTEVAN